MAFRLVEPLRTWTATFRGQATETSTAALIAGDTDGPTVDLEFDLEFDLEATMAVPPWIQGTLFREIGRDAGHLRRGQAHGWAPVRAAVPAVGAVRVRGEEHPFTGSGLRIRRQGVRDIAEFCHAWQSALFPSGRAFGYIAYPPRPDGSESYNEGHLFEGGGELIPAKVRKAPWLQHLVGNGEDVSLELETADGVTRIEAETVVSTYELGLEGYPQFPVLSQCTVRYRWDGEETYGMLERSSMRDKIIWP